MPQTEPTGMAIVTRPCPMARRRTMHMLALGCLALVAGAGLQAGGPEPRDEDPLPLVRIAVSPEQLAQELARLKQGALIRLPRAEFEARVRQASQALLAPKAVARVVRAHYLAELSDQNLTLGRGEWAVQNPGEAAAILPLAPLSLALSNCAWEDGRDAVVGDLDGKGMAAWVEEPGIASMFFDWSCRGTATPKGLTFDLRLPASPQTTLELKLPADSWPTLPARSGLLTGPHDAGTPGKKLWKVQVAGKTQVELTIRTAQPGPPPALFYQTQARQVMTPDRIAADYEFHVEVPLGVVRELIFDGDASLEPFEVTSPATDLQWRWEPSPSTAKGKPGSAPGTLVVEFRAPQQGTIPGLRVRCLAPRPAAPTDWVSPALRLRQATCRSETLQMQFHPDVHLERWEGGDFHLTGGATETDGGLTLTLVDTRATIKPPSARPRCQLVTGVAEFAATQQTRWTIEPEATSLHCEIAYDVSRGQLHQLAVRLPAIGGPYQVESVELTPKDLLRDWAPAGQLLLVELQRGLTPRTDARLSVRLRSTFKGGAGAVTLDLPDMEPLGASVRDARLTIALDPSLHSQLWQSSVPPIPGTAGAEGNAAAFAFAYRDQALVGKLRLFPQKPQIQVRSRQEIALGRGDSHWQARVEIEPLIGRPLFVDIHLSAALSQPWQARVEGQPALVHHWERLPVQEALPYLLALGSQDPLGRAALQVSLPSGQLWRVHFARPLATKTTLLLGGPFRAVDAPTAEHVPFLSLVGVLQHENAVIVRPMDQQPQEDALCESSDLTSCMEADGTLHHIFRLRLRNWQQPRFDIVIPGTVTALAARIDGGWLDRVDTSPTPDGTRFSLPVHAGAAAQWIEMLYRSPSEAASWPLVQALQAHHPQLPQTLNAPLVQRRSWRLPSGWVPCDPGRMRPRGQPAASAEDVGPSFSLLSTRPEPGWIEWEPIPGLPLDETLIVFQVPSGRPLGFILAVLWLLPAGWSARRLSAPTFFRAHLLAAGLMTLAVLWLPGAPRDLLVWPLLVAELLVFVFTFTVRSWPGRARRVSPSTMVRPAGAVALLGLCLAGLPLLAQVPAPGPEPFRVFLVGTGDAGKEFALVSPDLLKKLDDLDRRPAGPPGGVVVSAQFLGKVKESLAEVDAKLDLYHFADKSTFVLPLNGVRLKPGIFLNGAPVFPVATKSGYAFSLHGKGFHRLSLAFEVRPTLGNDYYEMRFGIPKAGQCKLELSWAAPSRGLQLLGGLGDDNVQLDKKGVATLRAQLGHEGLVQVRWQAAQSATPAKSVEVREAYYWDLRPPTLNLTAAVQFGIASGSLVQVRFALPEGLEVRAVEVPRRANGPVVPGDAMIRQWEVVGKDASRQLVVGFAQPVSGNLPLLIEMVPRIALTPGQWLLRLPTPLQVNTTEGFLAYRLEGLDAVPSPFELSIATDKRSAELFGDAWAKLALRMAPTVSKAHSFRRLAPGAALGLAVKSLRPTAQLDLAWTVGARHAELNGHVNLSSPTEGHVLVEIELPPRFKLKDIDGPDVHHWSRQDRLVQVWLRQPRQQTHLQVRGWANHTPGPARFDLSAVRVLNAGAMTSSVVVTPDPRLSITVETLKQLARTGKTDALRFASSEPSYDAAFSIRPASAPITGRAFTLVERRGNVVEMTTALHFRPQVGEVRVTASNWLGEELRLDVPAPIVRKAYQQTGTTHTWILQFPPGLPQTVTLTLHGHSPPTRPLDAWSLPGLNLGKTQLQDHWLALSGVELAHKNGPAMQTIPANPKAPSAYSAPPRTLGPGVKVGQLKDGLGGLTVRIPTAAASVQILLAQQDTFWGGARWAHQLQLLAFTKGDGELRLQLPDGAIGRAVAIADRVIVPRGGELVIPLPGPAGPRLVQVCWDYPQELEGPGAPRFNTPTVAGLDTAVFQARFWLPPAYGPPRRPDGDAELAVEALLNQAESRMRVCALSADAGASTEDLLREQQVFHDDLKQAESKLSVLDGAAELKLRARDLAAANTRLAREKGYENAAQRAAGPSTAVVPLPVGESGLPIIWGMHGVPPPAPLPLTSILELDEIFAYGATQLLLLGAVALLLLSYLRHGLAMFSALWPELLMAVALFGAYRAGPGPVEIALMGAGVGLRAVWIVLAVRRVLAARSARAAEPSLDGAAPSQTPPSPQ